MDAYSFYLNVREKSPLVHHLTNWVTIYDCAQVVKSFGASPVMAHAVEEVEEMVRISSALVINIGTLTGDFIASAKKAALAANAAGIPVVLDVCGAGATSFRDRMNHELISETKINVIKGNASEIARIAGLEVQTKGVDSSAVDADMKALAASLAEKCGCTVVVTGKEDVVATASSRYLVGNGHEMMSHVVGTGCMAASVIGTFIAANPADPALAAAAGLSCFGIAAQIAMESSAGPGTFKERLFDAIYSLNAAKVSSMQRVTS